MKMRLLRAAKVRELVQQIQLNLDRYRTGDFDYLEFDPSNYIESNHEMNDELVADIQCTENEHKEVENCEKMYQAMNGLSLYLARDERIWIYLVHTNLLAYSRKRWPIPDDESKAIQHIRNHYFVIGARGFERDNSGSRLWWMATLCKRAQGLTLNQALSSLLYQYDVRANIIERPTTSQNVRVFSGILAELHKSYLGDQRLFEREKFRGVMKELNLRGGRTLLDALNDNELSDLLAGCMA